MLTKNIPVQINKMILSYYDNNKKGPVVLFIHGTASAKVMWEKQYEILNGTNYRVIGIDLRGHGNSPYDGGDCTINDHIFDLSETLSFIGINEPIAIVGHSFGAVLAVRFAEEYPNMVNRLLLISFPAKISKILHRYYDWLLGKPIEILKKKIKLVLNLPLKTRHKLAISADVKIVRQIWKESLKWDFVSQPPKINCPVYLSVGRFDYIALKSMVKKIHEELPNSSYKVFNWSSHTCMDDEPKEFNKWILTALSATIS